MIEQADPTTLTKLKDAIYSFALFGMTQQVQIDMKMIISSIIVGVLAAFGSSYVAADRTSTKLEQYAREQAEFRQEMRSYMRDRNAEVLAIYERQARVEAKIDAQQGMSGMNNGKR